MGISLKLTYIVLASVVLIGLWPMVGIAGEPLEVTEFRAQKLRERWQQELQRAHGALDLPLVPSAITLIPGFSVHSDVHLLTDARGFVTFPNLQNFQCCFYVVERSLNRVSRSAFNGPVLFATGLSTPTDLVSPGRFGSSPFGNFLYVTESGANRISKIDQTGAVTTFVSFTSAPNRMAFSPDLGAFGTDLLFVTLADGRLVKVSPTGTVTPCASGLSGPEGLVFGPGGAAFKDTLFVAESTANRISRVSPACTVSPLAAGLSNPVGLEISPGGAWGPLDMLYVVNATSRVDRVDKDGNVTSFASGFTKADTLRFEFFDVSGRLGAFSSLRVSDATTTAVGTIDHVNVNFPFAFPQLAGCDPCRAGDDLLIIVRIENQSPIALPMEIKAGFYLLDGTPLTFAPLLGGNRHFEAVLPPGLSFSKLWVSVTMPPVKPGRYCYEIGLIDQDLVFGAGFVTRGLACFRVLP